MITLTIKDTPAGVVIDAAGPLHAIGDAPWVARTMIDHAAPLFAGGRPILLGGQADPVHGIEVIEHGPDDAGLNHYPATCTVHAPTGPVHCCAHHATTLVSLMHFLGTHAAQTEAPIGAQCSNCQNEAGKKG